MPHRLAVFKKRKSNTNLHVELIFALVFHSIVFITVTLSSTQKDEETTKRKAIDKEESLEVP